MHLYVSPENSWLVRTAANVVLWSHIGAGGVGLVSGTGALTFRKGGRAHRLAGNVFFVSMLAMSGIGTCVAPFLPQRGSIIGGAFTFYLVATAWMTVRRKAGTVGSFESQVFPAPIQDSSILYVPEVFILGLLIFWMFRVQLSKRYRSGA